MTWTQLDWQDVSTHPPLNKFVLIGLVPSEQYDGPIEYCVAAMNEIPEQDRITGDDWWRYWIDQDGDYGEWISDRYQWAKTYWMPINTVPDDDR